MWFIQNSLISLSIWKYVHPKRMVLCIVLFLLALLISPLVHAEDSTSNFSVVDNKPSLNPETNSDTSPSQENFWTKAWGTTGPTTLYLGMFTVHLRPGSSGDNWNNELIALSHKGYFAGTLLNSFGDRAYAAGIERYWFTQEITPNLNGSLGYRLGLITGYDGRMLPIAEHTPVLPFPQLIYDLKWKHAGLEFSWCAVTLSAGFFYAF